MNDRKKQVFLMNFVLSRKDGVTIDSNLFLRGYQSSALSSIVDSTELLPPVYILIPFDGRNKRQTVIDNIKSQYQKIQRKGNVEFLAFDFTRYSAVATTVFFDLLVRNCFSQMVRRSNVVIFVSDVRYALGSHALEILGRRLKKVGKKSKRILLFSPKGEFRVLGPDVQLSKHYVPSADIDKEEGFRNALLKFSDVFYPGHYQSPSPSNLHLGMYIEMNPLVHDPSIYHYAMELLSRVKASQEFDTLVGFGVPSDTISKFGNDAARDLGLKYYYYDEKSKRDCPKARW